VIISIVTWVIQISFWAGLFQQVLLNFRIKSTRGLSDLMLIGYFYGFMTYSYYIFLFPFPLAYKIMVPISVVTMLVMIVQRFVYEQKYKTDKKLLAFFCASACAAFAILPYAYAYPKLVGNTAGWISILIWGSYQLPQVFKNYTRQSVAGFSFVLLNLCALGDILEFTVAFVIGLPIQTKANGARGIIIYLIFCVQFWKYKFSKHTQENVLAFRPAEQMPLVADRVLPEPGTDGARLPTQDERQK